MSSVRATIFGHSEELNHYPERARGGMASLALSLAGVLASRGRYGSRDAPCRSAGQALAGIAGVIRTSMVRSANFQSSSTLRSLSTNRPVATTC